MTLTYIELGCDSRDEICCRRPVRPDKEMEESRLKPLLQPVL